MLRYSIIILNYYFNYILHSYCCQIVLYLGSHKCICTIWQIESYFSCYLKISYIWYQSFIRKKHFSQNLVTLTLGNLWNFTFGFNVEAIKKTKLEHNIIFIKIIIYFFLYLQRGQEQENAVEGVEETRKGGGTIHVTSWAAHHGIVRNWAFCCRPRPSCSLCYCYTRVWEIYILVEYV